MKNKTQQKKIVLAKNKRNIKQDDCSFFNKCNGKTKNHTTFLIVKKCPEINTYYISRTRINIDLLLEFCKKSNQT